jgi:hypothetical protein
LNVTCNIRIYFIHPRPLAAVATALKNSRTPHAKKIMGQKYFFFCLPNATAAGKNIATITGRRPAWCAVVQKRMCGEGEVKFRHHPGPAKKKSPSGRHCQQPTRWRRDARSPPHRRQESLQKRRGRGRPHHPSQPHKKHRNRNAKKWVRRERGRRPKSTASSHEETQARATTAFDAESVPKLRIL